MKYESDCTHIKTIILSILNLTILTFVKQTKLCSICYKFGSHWLHSFTFTLSLSLKTYHCVAQDQVPDENLTLKLQDSISAAPKEHKVKKKQKLPKGEQSVSKYINSIFARFLFSIVLNECLELPRSEGKLRPLACKKCS